MYRVLSVWESMRTLVFVSLILCAQTLFAQVGSEGCSFNKGQCVLRDGLGTQIQEGHGYVQNYGYGGITSSAITGARVALNVPGTLIDELRGEGLPNPECEVSPGASIQTGFAVGWNGDCSDANRVENKAIHCAGVAGLGYKYESINSILTINEHLDDRQEEIIYQTAVGDIHDFTSCQKDFFDKISYDQAVRRDLFNNAYQQFSDVKNAIRNLQSQRDGLSRRLGNDLVLRQSTSNCGDAASCAMTFNESLQDPEIVAIQARISSLTDRINMLVSRIPIGNRDNMSRMLKDLLLSTQDVSPAQFNAAYSREIQNVRNEIDTSLATIAGITVHRPGEKKNFCVDRELKKNLVRSGQLEHTIERMGLTQALDGFTCRAENRYGAAGEVISELALIPSYFVGYGFARLAVKAGASTIRAVSAAGRTLATASRGAMLGLEAADWASAGAAAIRDCNSDDFYAQVSARQGCDPMAEVAQMYQESSLAQCLSSALIPAGSALVGTGVRVVESARLARATQGVPRVLDEVAEEGEEIVSIASTSTRGGFFITKEDSRLIESQLPAQGIAPGSILTPQQLATLTDKQTVSLFEGMSDLALSPAQARTFLDILKDAKGSINPRAETRLREFLSGEELSPQQVNTIVLRVRRSKLFEVEAPGTISLRSRSAGGNASTSTPRSLTGEPPVSAANRSVTSDQLLDSVPQSVPGREGLKTFADETRQAIRSRFDQWSPQVRADVSELLAGLSEEKKRRYLSMLLNSHPVTDPSRVIQRIRLMETGTEAQKRQVMQELEAEIQSLSEQMRGRQIFDLQGVNLGAQRSSLMMQRTLFDLGDEIQIDRIFSSTAYNATARGEPHSLGDAFNLDIKVVGSNVSVCRGSLATATSMSGLAGGFSTICRKGGYIDNQIASDVLAAPRSAADGELGGYSRFNRFDLPPGSEVSLGRNGPVNYTFNGSEGTGGNGGGVEFFFSRSTTPLQPSQVSQSVRTPSCVSTPGSACSQIFEIQAGIRIDALPGATARASLEQSATRTDGIISSLSQNANLLRAGETPAQALVRVEREQTELMSALNLRREIQLKTAPAAGRRDADTELMLSRMREADSYAPQINTALKDIKSNPGASARNIEDFVRNNPLTRDYNRFQQEAESLLTQASRASGGERERLLRELARVRGQQSDLRLAYHGYAYNIEKTIKSQLGLERGDPLPQELLDAINAGAGGIVVRSN